MSTTIQTRLNKKAKNVQQNKRNKNAKLKKNKPDSDSDDDLEDEDEDEEDKDEESVVTSDSSYKPPKKTSTKKSNRKVAVSKDDDDEDDAVVNETVKRFEIQKFLSRLFPSKYMQSKVEDQILSEMDADTKKKSSTSKKSKKTQKPNKKQKKVVEEEEEEEEEVWEDDDEEDEDDDDEEDDEDDEEDDEDEDPEKSGFYNIVFSTEDDLEDDEYFEDDDDVECNSDDEEAFMKEKYVRVHDSELNEKKTSKPTEETDTLADVEQEYLDLVETKKTLSNQLKKKPTSKILKNAVKECTDSIKSLIKDARSKNAKAYHSLIHGDKKRTNEIDYFKKKLSNKEQLRIMKDLKEINSHINIEKPYRLALLDSQMPSKFKAVALQKLNVLRSMDPGDNEYYKIKNWVDTFMRIPFGKYQSLTVQMDDGIERCQEFMESAKLKLDNCVYGLEDAKMQIMQMIGQWIANPAAMGSAIAIKGPPGTGKTSLVKEGISKIMGREFTFIALGGTGDASFLEGHSYTYEGSTWGKIVQILIDSKCMNPVIYFDELDKISDTPRGEEIVGILTHLTDTSQNSQFHDKYFSEVDFDLSKCLFIFSYNDESKVNPILRDRMYRIQTSGYDAKEKTVIARDYLLPKICEQVNFRPDDIIIPDDTVQYIVSNSVLTGGESGVRNLKRCLEIIYTKLNLFRLLKPSAKILGKDAELNVSFPFTVTKKEVDILIKNEEKQNQSMLAMYV